MAFDFPNAPALNAVYTSGGVTYVWNGQGWINRSASLSASAGGALSYSGMQMNGSFDASQEFGGTGRASIGYFCDGWLLGYGGTMAAVGAAATAGNYFPGFRNFGQISVTTAQASLGAGDALTMYHRIEGSRVARLAWGTLNAKPITIGFWSSHSKIGVYSVAVRAPDNSRSYVAAYTQAASNVQQYNVVTIAGCPDGVWPTDNAHGMTVDFPVAAGSGLIAAPGAWNAANKIGATGQVNGADSTANFFRIGGVIILPGIEAPTAAQSPLIMRPYDQELPACLRHYQKFGPNLYRSDVITLHYAAVPALVPMRAVPTASLINPVYGTANGAQIANASSFGAEIGFTCTAVGGYVQTTIILDARL